MELGHNPRPRAGRLRRTTSHATEAARTTTACVNCRSRKIKCSGTHPCRLCLKKSQECIFPPTNAGRKKLYSVAYVEALEQRAITSIEHPNASPETVTIVDSISPVPSSILIPEPSMSSSLRFGSHVKSLSRRSVSSDLRRRSMAIGNLDSPDDAYDLWSTTGPENPHHAGFQWPTEDQARPLFEVVLESIGTVQHLFDPRAFSDELASTYEDNGFQDRKPSLFAIEVILVMSIGQLIQGISSPASGLPGAEYFQVAMHYIPGLSDLRRAGSLGVEILALATFYLQCADCKEDAYVYAGLALRLAISNGFARQHTVKKTSQATHSNRLWWTVYMQERRLASATGNPVGISDEVITTALPYSSPGFQSPHALSTNIRLARIIGRITQDIYGFKHGSAKALVLQTQQILSDLVQTEGEMPDEYRIDSTNESDIISRTGLTLYLMLLQAVMLVTRPTVLHVAQTKLQGQEPRISPEGPDRTLLNKFFGACIEAARNTLRVTKRAREQGILVKFGFFDLDAIFQAAFVLVMAEVTSPSTADKPSIRTSIELLDYLSQSGNMAAKTRLKDIYQMCSHLNIDTGTENITLSRSDTDSAALATQVAGQRIHSGQADLSFPHDPWTGMEGLLNMQYEEFVLSQDDVDLTSGWHHNAMNLDGTVATDWGDIERATAPSL